MNPARCFYNFCYIWNIFGLCMLLICCVDATSISHRHRNVRNELLQKEPEKISLQATLSFDFGAHQSANLPKTVEVEKSVEYYFPVDHQFKFFCDVKNPSHMSKMTISKEQILPNGNRLPEIQLLNPNAEDDMEVLHPDIKDNRLTVTFEQKPAHVKNTLIIKPLKLNDTGIYKCKYRKMEKQANVLVYKEAKMNQIIFPVEPVVELPIDKIQNISCKVVDVYPKPVINFWDNDNVTIRDDKSIHEENTPIKPNTYEVISSTKIYSYTPKYTDYQRKLTCHVFSYGSNSTISKSISLNIVGLKIITQHCLSQYSANLNDNIIITCEFFSNPKVNSPVWEIKRIKKSSVDALTSVDNNAISGAVNEAASIEEIVKIQNIESNYITSVGSMGDNGVYQARLRIVTVTDDDFRNFTLRLNNGKEQIEKVIVLTKVQQSKEKELGGSSNAILVSPSSAKQPHSSAILTLFIQFVLFFCIFSR